MTQRDLLAALRQRDAAVEKLDRIRAVLDAADASGMFGIATRDVRDIVEGKS